MNSPEPQPAPAENAAEMPQDLRQRIEQTVVQLREQGADFQTDAATAAAAPKRSTAWIAALVILMVAEIGVIALAGRMDGESAPVAREKTPCEQTLANVESALAAFRAEEGRLPGTLELLVPKYLPAIPKVGGHAVEYEGQGEGYVLHCLDS